MNGKNSNKKRKKEDKIMQNEMKEKETEKKIQSISIAIIYFNEL